MGKEGAGMAQNFVNCTGDLSGLLWCLKPNLFSCLPKVLPEEVAALPPYALPRNILKLKAPCLWSLWLLMCVCVCVCVFGFMILILFYFCFCFLPEENGFFRIKYSLLRVPNPAFSHVIPP